MIKLLLGGSPCTYWSITQKNNRETEPSGMGGNCSKIILSQRKNLSLTFSLNPTEICPITQNVLRLAMSQSGERNDKNLFN